MLKLDFTQIDEPFDFLKEMMIDSSEEEIKEAHENLCEFLNVQVRIFNRRLENGEIDLDS